MLEFSEDTDLEYLMRHEFTNSFVQRYIDINILENQCTMR